MKNDDTFLDIIKFIVVFIGCGLIILWLASDPIWESPTDKTGGWFYHYQTLIAGIFAFNGGAFVYFAARKQIKASLKERWLHDFRTYIVEFLDHSSRLNELEADLTHYYEQISLLENSQTLMFDNLDRKYQEKIKLNKDKYSQTQKDITFSQNAANRLMLQVQLFLNREKKSHKELDILLGRWSRNSNRFKEIIKQPLSEEMQNELEIITQESWQIKKNIIYKTHFILNDEINTI